MRRVLLAILCVCLLAPGAGSADQPIQPGAQVRIRGSLCTLNFVFEGGGKTYIGTAGHCGKKDDRVQASSGEFGTIRYQRNDDLLDFALIEVDAAKVGQVDPSIRGYGAAGGATAADDTRTADELFIHGYGVAFGSSAYTRSRHGFLMHDTAEWYTANMPAVNGDSGGPVVHVRSGKALGIISSYGVAYGQPATDRGPTVSHILNTVRAAGFSVSLA